VEFIKIWVLPPVLGAVIGYITNWLAIKMLFSPLKELRVFGIRVPFTPGLLPKERKRISQGIGETVAKELITADVIQERLAAPDVRAALEGEVESKLDELFATDVSNFVSDLTGASEGPLGVLAARAWSGLVASDAFSAAVGEAVRSAFSAAERLPLTDLISSAELRALSVSLLSDENLASLREKAASALERVYAETSVSGDAGAKGPLLGGLLPPEALKPLVCVFTEGLYRASIPVIENFLRQPDTKRGLESYANEIVRRAVGRLNVLQRLLVGATQYEKSIASTMPETVDDLVAAASSLLRDPAMPSRVSGAALSALDSAVDEPLSALIRRLVSHDAALAAVDAALAALRDTGPSIAEKAYDLVAKRPGLSVASALASLGLPADVLAARARSGAGSLLSGAGAGGELLQGALASFTNSLSGGLRAQAVGSIVGVDSRLKRELAVWISDKALELVSSEAGKIIEGFDIGRVVIEKIDALDMMEMEKMIIDLVDKELKWITILGGVLGGLIGFIQSFISLIPM
jgi:hypothetical protein